MTVPLFRCAFVLPVGLCGLLAACTGGTSDSVVPDSHASDSTSDTGTVVTPVWTNCHIETSSTFHGVYASGEGTYIVGSGGQGWVGTASVGFSAVTPPVTVDLHDLWGTGSGDTVELYAAGDEGHIEHYANSAWTDSDLGTNNFEGLGGSGPSALYSVGWGGIYESDGTNWTFVSPPGQERLNDVWGSAGDAVAVGEDGAAAVRSGGTWTSSTTGVQGGLHSVSGTTASDVWAVGDAGTVLHFDGNAWSVIAVPTTLTLWGVWAADASDVFAVGDGGLALHYDGSTWTSLPTGVNNNLYAVHGSSATNVWAVGNLGAAIQYKP